MNSKDDYLLVPGKRPIKEYLKHAPDKLISVYLEKDKNTELVQEIKDLNIPIEELPFQKLNKLSKGVVHQGIIAKVQQKEILNFASEVERLESLEQGFVLLLDSIFDPHNFGAILRAANCFGVDSIIWSKNKGCQITPVVMKSSVGAIETSNLIQVSNLNNTLEKLKSIGFWTVLSDCGETAESLENFEFPKKTALILGSEGKGASDLLVKNSDFKVKIPMFGQVESLNVSQATAVFLAAYCLKLGNAN